MFICNQYHLIATPSRTIPLPVSKVNQVRFIYPGERGKATKKRLGKELNSVALPPWVKEPNSIAYVQQKVHTFRTCFRAIQGLEHMLRFWSRDWISGRVGITQTLSEFRQFNFAVVNGGGGEDADIATSELGQCPSSNNSILLWTWTQTIRILSEFGQFNLAGG